jgi:molybdopterin adenylyltransferase
MADHVRGAGRGPHENAAGPADKGSSIHPDTDPAVHKDAGARHDKGGHNAKDALGAACAIVTVSDTRTADDDASGAEIRRQLEGAGHRVDDYRIVPDDPGLVRRAVEEMAAGGRIDVVLLSGGTGVAPRDTTFEAVSSLLSKRIDGFGELFRMLSFDEIGAAAMLSRAVGGLVGTMALFSMPGSTAACRLAMEKLVIPQLPHVVGLARPRR